MEEAGGHVRRFIQNKKVLSGAMPYQDGVDDQEPGNNEGHRFGGSYHSENLRSRSFAHDFARPLRIVATEDRFSPSWDDSTRPGLRVRIWYKRKAWRHVPGHRSLRRLALVEP